MNRLSLAIIVSAFFGSNALANSQHIVHTGPAKLTWETDRYSSQGSLEIIYRGYLVNCQNLGTHEKPIVAHLIFHHGNQTQIFRQHMHRNCEPNFFSREIKIALIRSQQYEPSQRAFWSYLERTRYEDVDFELAFEKDGAWDGNYGQNFPVEF